jgi:hypothetical protein
MLKPLILFRSPADSHLHKLIKVNIPKSNSCSTISTIRNKTFNKKIVKLSKSYSNPL